MLIVGAGVGIVTKATSSAVQNLATLENADFNGSDWSHSNGVYTRSTTGFSRLGFNGVEENKTFRVQFDLVLTAGQIRLFKRDGGNSTLQAFTVNGSYDLTVDAVDYQPGELYSLWFDDGSFLGSLSNVSITEVA